MHDVCELFLSCPQYVSPVSLLCVDVFFLSFHPSVSCIFPPFLHASLLHRFSLGLRLHPSPLSTSRVANTCCLIAALKIFPRMRNRLKDRDKVKSLFRRSMCKKDCGRVFEPIMTVAFDFTANFVILAVPIVYFIVY